MIGLSRTAYWRRRLGNAIARRMLPGDAQRRRSLRNIRTDMAALGFLFGDLTDDELEAGILRAGAAVRSIGVSAEDAARSLAALDRAWPKDLREVPSNG